MDYAVQIAGQITKLFNTYTGQNNKYAVTLLLLIDRKPVTEWIDGIPHRAHIMVSSRNLDIVYKPKGTARISKDVNKVAAGYKGGTLEMFLRNRNQQFLLPEWAAIDGLQVNNPLGMINTFTFESYLKEIDAISLVSDEYQLITQVLGNESFHNEHEIWNITFPQPVPSKLWGTCQFHKWLSYMYANYMCEANIELMDYYVRNARNRTNSGIFATMYTLTEFVPLFMQFENIENPFMWTEIQQLFEKHFSSWYLETYRMTQAPSIKGARVYSTSVQENMAICTTRGTVEAITHVSAEAKSGPSKNVNLYSVKYFLGLILNAIWSPTNTEFEPPMVWAASRIPWYQLVSDGRIVGFSSLPVEASETITVTPVTYAEMLFAEYLAGVYGYTQIRDITVLRRQVLFTPTVADIKKAGVLGGNA